MDTIHRVLRYLKSTHGRGVLMLRTRGHNLNTYCDSEWLGCPYTQHSRTQSILLFGGPPSLGKQRNILSFLFRLLKQSIILWLPLLVKFSRSNGFFKNSTLLLLDRPHYFVIIRLLVTLQITMFFINA